MKPIINIVECLRDSPQFRLVVGENEKSLENLENKLEKIIKNCSQMVTTGKAFNLEQEQLVHSLWELSSYFSDDTIVQGALNCMLDALKEAANYHRILIDQAARAIIKNFSSFIKEDVKKLNEKRHWFEKASSDLDSVLHKSSNLTKVNECEDLSKQVWATRQAFRHTAIDYMHATSIVQAKKRHEVVDAILSYTKAYSTFYHQGSDLCDDLRPALEKISKEVKDMREEETELNKKMENRHVDVTGRALVPANDEDQCVLMQGYLFKRTNNAFKSWNRRYFTLQKNQLVYRKRSGEEITVMEEDLRLCSVKPAVDIERRFCFEITSNVKNHMLQAESEESCRLWIEAVMRAISSAIHNDTPCVPKTSAESHLNSSTTSVNSSPTDSPASVKHISNLDDIKKRRLKGIQNIPGNEVCCDCGIPEPKWASINLGITLCIECSGIHRSLGVHYSKVRSLTLDHWELEILPVMESLGNGVVNQIYLANLPSGRTGESTHFTLGSQEYYMATPKCDRSIRETWIKKKYLDKSFVAPISNEESFSKIVNHSRGSSEGRSNPNIVNRTGDEADSSDGSEHVETTNHRSTLVGDSSRGRFSENALRMESLTPNDLLLSASIMGHLPLMCMALALGGNKNHQNHEGRTPLHLSIMSNCPAAVEYLLLNGSQVNLQDNKGQTSLHLSSIKADIILVYRLIKYRADWNIRDSEGRSPVDYAVQSSEPDLVTLLRVATLSEQLDKEEVEEEMMTIMQDLYRRNNTALGMKND